jgi:hypothetical protein
LVSSIARKNSSLEKNVLNGMVANPLFVFNSSMAKKEKIAGKNLEFSA